MWTGGLSQSEVGIAGEGDVSPSPRSRLKRPYRAPEVRSNETPPGVWLFVCSKPGKPVHCLTINGTNCCAASIVRCIPDCPVL